MKTLPERLRWARTAAGLKSRELDKLAGLAEGHTSMIETGRRTNLVTETAVAIASTLGVSLDWLISGVGKEPSARTVRHAVDRARTGTDG